MKVLAFGTFDILHKGHEYFLKSAKGLGDELVVVVARDNTVRAIKNHEPKNKEDFRLKEVDKLDYVDEAMLGSNEEDKYRIIEDIKPDIIALGYDQNSYSNNLLDELIKRKISAKVIRLQAYQPEKYKSSKLK